MATCHFLACHEIASLLVDPWLAGFLRFFRPGQEKAGLVGAGTVGAFEADIVLEPMLKGRDRLWRHAPLGIGARESDTTRFTPSSLRSFLSMVPSAVKSAGRRLKLPVWIQSRSFLGSNELPHDRGRGMEAHRAATVSNGTCW